MLVFFFLCFVLFSHRSRCTRLALGTRDGGLHSESLVSLSSSPLGREWGFVFEVSWDDFEYRCLLSRVQSWLLACTYVQLVDSSLLAEDLALRGIGRGILVLCRLLLGFGLLNGASLSGLENIVGQLETSAHK